MADQVKKKELHLKIVAPPKRHQARSLPAYDTLQPLLLKRINGQPGLVEPSIDWETLSI